MPTVAYTPSCCWASWIAQSSVPVPGPSPLPMASRVVTPASFARAKTSTRSASKRLFSRWQCESVYMSEERLHGFQFFFHQLLVVKLGVVAIARDEFVVGAVLDDDAVVQHGDAIGVAHG